MKFVRQIKQYVERQLYKLAVKLEDAYLDHQADRRLIAALRQFKPDEQLYVRQILRNQNEYLRWDQNTYRKLNAELTHQNLMFDIASTVCQYLRPLFAIIGVQPMSGPVQLIYRLAIQKADNKLRLTITKDGVEAGTRKLQPQLMIEAMQDVRLIHGVDASAEIATAIASEIANEFFAEYLYHLLKAAGEPVVVETPENADHMGAASSAAVAIMQVANDIARATRRGAGNFIVCSHITATTLQAILGNNFVPAQRPSASTSMFYKVGTMMGNIAVYVSLHPEFLGEDRTTETILVGYKGKASELDAGMVFCPYMLVMNSGIVINPITFGPLITFKTRYGHKDYDASDEFPAGSSAYYRVLKVKFPDLLQDVSPETVDQLPK